MSDRTEQAIETAIDQIDRTLAVLDQGRQAINTDRETRLIRAVAQTIVWRKAS